MAERIQVVEVYAGGGVGGAAAHLALIFETLPAQGIDLTLLSLPPHAVRERIAALGGRVESVDGEREAAAWLAGKSFEVLHTHGFRPTTVALRMGPHPWVRTVHSPLRADYTSSAKRFVATLAEKRALRRADVTVAVSQALADERLRLGAPKDRLRVIWNAVPPPSAASTPQELRARAGVPARARVALMLARLQAVKGVDRAVAALSALPDDWHLVVFGDGPDGPALIAHATSAGVLPRLHLLPFEPGARRYLAGADVVLIASRDEGFSMVAVEAQAVGAPVAATRVGGIPEALGEAAVYIDSPIPSGVAAAILAAARDAQSLGERGRARYVAHFRPEAFARATAEILKEVADKPSGNNSMS